MKKLITILALLLIPTLTFAQEYTTVSHTGHGEVLDILRNGKVIYSIVPKYKKEIIKGDWAGKTSLVHPAYHYLIDRSRAVNPRPKAFDDITGDGLPNFVCYERVEWFGNSAAPGAIRVFSISEDKVEELGSILAEFGEVMYFADFNKDGTFEFVATDQENLFSYDEKGLPISDRAWIFDRKTKRYYQGAL
jgi:hypothetical protein